MAVSFFNKTGQSLIEILVAAGIFLLTSSATILLFFGGQSVSVDSANAGRALQYASEGLEAVRSIRTRDWNELDAGTYGLRFNNNQWELYGTNDAQDIFTRVISISDVAPDIKKVISTVTWQTDPQRPQSVLLVEELSDWKKAVSGACESEPLSGNWNNPQSLGSGDLGPGNQGTDIEVQLPYVFMSGVATSGNKPDVFVFDVSNPASPQLKKTIDVGSGGINSLFLKGNYLYAVSANNSKELIIFNITDPVNIVETTSLDLTGSDDALTVFVSSSTVIVGREESAAKELVFINSINPSNPQIIAELTVGAKVNDIYASNRRLYVVGDNTKDAWIYDMTDPAVPTLLTSFDIPNTSDARSVYILEKNGTHMLVGTGETGEFIVLDISDLANIVVRDRIVVGGTSGDVTCVQGDLAFLATSNSGKEFMIINISNPANLIEQASLNYPQLGTGIEFAQNKVYMSVRSNDSLRIIGPGP